MRKRSRSWRVASLLIPALSVGLLALFLLPRETNLFKRSHLIQQRTEISLTGSFLLRQSSAKIQIDWPYCWTGPHQILSLGSANGRLFDWDIYRRDSDTGAESRLAPEDKFLRSRHFRVMFAGNPSSNPIAPTSAQVRAAFNTQILASPDGKWTLWTFIAGDLSSNTEHDIISTSDPDYPTFDSDYLVSTDGLYHSMPESECGDPTCVWLRDSTRWIKFGGHWGIDAFASSPTLEIHYGADPGHYTSIPISIPISMALIGTTPEDRVVAVDWRNPVHGNIASANFFPDPKSVIPTRYTIPIPPDGRAVPVTSPLIAPKGDRIAWFVSIPSEPPGWPLTQKLWSIWKVKPQTVIALWTTRLDGGEPTEVGHYVLKNTTDMPSMLQWTPDSKRLSFRYQGSLYCVPAL